MSSTRFVRKLRRNFFESSKIQRFFPPKIRWSPKKRSSPKLRLIFRPNSEIQSFEGGLFSYVGGYFQFFTKNRPQKHQKRAILHTSQANGGARALPPPPWLRYCAQILRMKLLSNFRCFTRSGSNVS